MPLEQASRGGRAQVRVRGQRKVGIQAHYRNVGHFLRHYVGSPAMLVWMDLEMTGLDPARHVIVEIATLITDDDLNVVAEGPDLVINQPEVRLADMDDVVRKMHETSGLLAAIRGSTTTLDDAGVATLAFIHAHVTEPQSVPLCGNSIGTDRRFLAKYMPAIEVFLHYRSIDVSSFKELCRRWYPAVYRKRPGKAEQHRALDDVRESIEELRYYRDNMLKPSEQSAQGAEQRDH